MKMQRKLDKICTICKDPKPKDKFCCGKEKCIEAMGHIPKGRGYWMSICRDKKEETGIPVHTIPSKIERSLV
jgi:hypothetical protein